MMAIYGLIALMAVSFIGWALAECKYKTFGYEKTEEESQRIQGTEHPRYPQRRQLQWVCGHLNITKQRGSHPRPLSFWREVRYRPVYNWYSAI